jgi:hypothetical protein
MLGPHTDDAGRDGDVFKRVINISNRVQRVQRVFWEKGGMLICDGSNACVEHANM